MTQLPSVTHDHPDASDNRGIRLGVEIEVPFRPRGAEPMTAMGVPSNDKSLHDTELSHPLGGELTHEWIGGQVVDKVRGLEARTPDGGVPYYDLTDWYRCTVKEVEELAGRRMEPAGFFGKTTAGLHVHASPLTYDQAERLWELSQQPWMHVFAGTTIAGKDADGNDVSVFPVVRSGWKDRHLKIEDFDKRHDSCVNKHRKGGTGHYEWRVPEPMPPEHFELVVEFLVRFCDDADSAASWAKSLVQEGDRRITAFQRADALDKPISRNAPTATGATGVLLEAM